MYERNAIVLERYFYKIFDFNNNSNLKENYFNYRKLFESYGTLCETKKIEENSKKEFEIASKEISKLQKCQEKLYNKSAKYEYSRYIIFDNIKEKPEDIEKHLKKVNEDVQKNNEELKELGEKFVQAIISYNEKELNLKLAITERENAQKEYNDIYSRAQKCYDEISDIMIYNAKNFINSENKENRKELQDIFEENGKNERNTFDTDVILNTINKSIDIYKVEIEVYLTGIDRISRLFEEIENNSVKLEKHTKYYRDSKAKLDFLFAEKDYIVQFLDNERIGAIYDKKVHRKLMLEACKKFVIDFEQIDKLYDIILKEIAGRSTKKIYKENYNKEYLVKLESASVEPSLDTGKMRQDAIAFMNLNYWRLEGIKSVYNAFEKIVVEVYGKDLSEFIPESLKINIIEEEENNSEELQEEKFEDVFVEENENVQEVEIPKNKVMRRVYYSSKKVLANAIYFSLQTHEFSKSNQFRKFEEDKTEDDKYSIPENVKAILENVEKEESENFDKVEIDNNSESVFDLNKLDEIEYDEEGANEANYDVSDEASESEIYFNDTDLDNEFDNHETSVEKINKKVGLFKKLVGFNAAKRKREA